jgi:predicted ABC-type ATPase
MFELTVFKAARMMIERVRANLDDRKNFAFETTCSGKSQIPMLRICKANGWRITLLYFWLSSPELSIARVAQRVREGGHSIPQEVIRRRFVSGLRNMLSLYLPLADDAEIYDNDNCGRVLIAEKRMGEDLVVRDAGRWSRMSELTK